MNDPNKYLRIDSPGGSWVIDTSPVHRFSSALNGEPRITRYLRKSFNVREIHTSKQKLIKCKENIMTKKPLQNASHIKNYTHTYFLY